MPGDLTVQLSHVVPDAKRHALFMRTRKDTDAPSHAGEQVLLDTTIHDGRSADLKLDEASFELFEHPTKLATEDFYGGQRVYTEYYDEIRDLFKKVTGCAHVHVFHHQVRNKQRLVSGESTEGVSTSTPVQPYAYGIHTDSSCFHAEDMFKVMVQSAPPNCRCGRFLYINAWRNIAEEPVEHDHLAVLDERTLVKPDDYIQTELHGVGYDVLQYNLSSRNAGQHQWYYFPQMRTNEVLVFKQWDSDTLRPGRVCFHTAISDPTAPVGAPARQSIEVRSFLFFPDHKPNTCPVMPAPELGDEGGQGVTAVGGKDSIKNGLTCIESDTRCARWLLFFLQWQYKTGGSKSVLEVMVKDDGNHHELKEATAATKAKTLELLLQQGAGKHVDRIFAGPGPMGLMLRKLFKTQLGAALMGAATALAVSAMVKRCTK